MPCRLQSPSDSVVCTHTTGRQELQISPQSLLLLSSPLVFLFFFYLKDTAQGTIVLVFVLPCHWGKKEKRREAISHYDSFGNCRTIENEQGNLLPINCIFVWYSYHPNWIFMQNDAACVGTGSIIAKHARARYANGAYFPTNLKWLSLYHIHTMP